MNIQSNMVLNGLNAQQLFEFGKAGDSTAAQLNATFLSRDYRANVNLPNQRSDFKFVAPRQTQDETAARQANANARQTFLRYILKTCGVHPAAGDFSGDYNLIGRLPDVVREAMKCKGFTGLFKSGDWKASNQRPLTSRRIAAVMEALEVYKREEQYKTENEGREMPAAVRNLFRSNPAFARNVPYSAVKMACENGGTDPFIRAVKALNGKLPLGKVEVPVGEATGKFFENDFSNRMLDIKYIANHGGLNRSGQPAVDERGQWFLVDDADFFSAIYQKRQNGDADPEKLNIKDENNFQRTPFNGMSDVQKQQIFSMINSNGNGYTSNADFARLLGFPKDVIIGSGGPKLRTTILETSDNSWNFTVDMYQPVKKVIVGKSGGQKVALMYAESHNLVSHLDDMKANGSYIHVKLTFSVATPADPNDTTNLLISNVKASTTAVFRNLIDVDDATM